MGKQIHFVFTFLVLSTDFPTVSARRRISKVSWLMNSRACTSNSRVVPQRCFNHWRRCDNCMPNLAPLVLSSRSATVQAQRRSPLPLFARVRGRSAYSKKYSGSSLDFYFVQWKRANRDTLSRPVVLSSTWPLSKIRASISKT